jgi:hypothetical protein
LRPLSNNSSSAGSSERAHRRAIYALRWSRRRWFHTLRLIFWSVQVPFAVSIPVIRNSVPYLVFLSLAALVESAVTDVDNSRAAEKRGEEDLVLDPSE